MSYIRVNINCHNSFPKCIDSGEGRDKKWTLGLIRIPMLETTSLNTPTLLSSRPEDNHLLLVMCLRFGRTSVSCWQGTADLLARTHITSVKKATGQGAGAYGLAPVCVAIHSKIHHQARQPTIRAFRLRAPLGKDKGQNHPPDHSIFDHLHRFHAGVVPWGLLNMTSLNLPLLDLDTTEGSGVLIF